MSSRRHDFDSSFDFRHDGIVHPVFHDGAGPPVLVMHELPGLSGKTLDFGDRLASAGFRVFLPLLFGERGDEAPVRFARRLCVSEEFARLKAGTDAPIASWLRALAVEIGRRADGASVGVIGMCLTGGFVIPLVLEPCVRAPVAAQPGVPYRASYTFLGVGRGEWMSQLNVSDATLAAAAARADRDGVDLLAVRFEADRTCPAERLERLRSAFGERLTSTTLPGGPPWRRALKPRHSTLVYEYDDTPGAPTRVLFDDLVRFLKERLGAPAPPPPPGLPEAS